MLGFEAEMGYKKLTDNVTGKKIKILYIAGTSRSGTTILGSLLGQCDGFFSVGEIRYIWERGISENWMCGCGKNFNECPFWQKVVEYIKIKNARFDVNKLSKYNRLSKDIRKKYKLRARYFLLQPKKKIIESFKYVEDYVNILSDLYNSIKEISGAKVIVDTSKDPYYALFLSHIPNIELYIVHLVRDPRAVVFSQVFRKKKQIAAKNSEFIMGNELSPLKSLRNWMWKNFIINKFLNNRNFNYSRIRYEDFVEGPLDNLLKINKFIVENEDCAKNVINGRSFRPKTSHVFSGNPNRLLKGIVKINADEEWRSKLPNIWKIIIPSIAFWQIKKYGYKIN